jgi:type VI secretion system protein ImpH
MLRRLEQEPYRFDFQQAVRMLRLLSRQSTTPRRSVGRNHSPQEEIVRFRSLVSHRFPSAAIHSYRPAPQPASPDQSPAPPEMVVSFLGLTGPSGVLPRHYTQLLIDRVRQKDFALRDFLDLFNHRIISLFYRAWEKHHFPIAYEETASNPDARDEDLFTRCLYCLVGMGTGGLRNRLELDDRTLLHYGGLLAHWPRNALSLEAMVADYFGLRVSVLQFYGQWLYLSDDNQSRLEDGDGHTESNNQLGWNVVVGDRVWGVESKFRVRLGPLSYQQFQRFMPGGDCLVPVGQLVRTYVGSDLDFDIQPVLQREDVPCARLGGDETAPSCLGWNTWIRTAGMSHDADDAVFEVEGTAA